MRRRTTAVVAVLVLLLVVVGLLVVPPVAARLTTRAASAPGPTHSQKIQVLPSPHTQPTALAIPSPVPAAAPACSFPDRPMTRDEVGRKAYAIEQYILAKSKHWYPTQESLDTANDPEGMLVPRNDYYYSTGWAWKGGPPALTALTNKLRAYLPAGDVAARAYEHPLAVQLEDWFNTVEAVKMAPAMPCMAKELADRTT